jgi:fumarate hydratase subunit beta
MQRGINLWFYRYSGKAMNRISITTPLSAAIIRTLHAGDAVLISGTVYTARDAAHKRLCGCIEHNKPLPVNLQDQILYFVGPTPAPPGKPIGSAGPTTGARMDAFSPLLIEKTGLRGMIGKGNRNKTVVEAMKKYGCVYCAATGGAGALLSKSIVQARIVCYEDLGPEAMYVLEFRDFPAFVAIDVSGNNLYESGPERFKGHT